VDFWTAARERLLKEKVDDALRLRSTPYDAVRDLIEDFSRQ
jgi:hypothetical protein